MLAKIDTATEWEVLREQARVALASKFIPKSIQTPEQAVAIAMAGRELGLPPMTAFRSIHLVEGKVTMSADLMHGLVYQRVPGGKVDIIATDNERCQVDAKRPGGKLVSIVFTIEDAKNAGLTGKDVWRKYPAAMLRARAIAAACRAVFPDVFLGVYVPDELEQPTSSEEVEEHKQIAAPVQAKQLEAPKPDVQAIFQALAEDVNMAESIDDLKFAWVQVANNKRHLSAEQFDELTRLKEAKKANLMLDLIEQTEKPRQAVEQEQAHV
jgi:hypothetical protein